MPPAPRAGPRRRSGRSPASPWIGSIITAAVRSPTAPRSASGSSRGKRRRNPPAGARTGPRERASASPPAYRASGRGRRHGGRRSRGPRSRAAWACFRASLIAHSFASAPELQRKTLPPRLDSDEPLAEPHRRLRVVEVGDARQPLRLVADRGHDPRVAVAGVVDREPGEEVQVLLAVGVPQPRSLAAHELHRRPRIGRHRIPRLQRLQLSELMAAARG